MRVRLAAVIAAAAFAAGCHSEPTGLTDNRDATAAAQTLLHIADSLSAHGGSTTEVGAYRGLAALLVGTGRLSTVTITVDGTPSEYLATAQQIQFGCPPNAVCDLMLTAPLRSVVAWEKRNPRRVVQLFTADFGGTTSFPAPPGMGSLMYLDGTGAMYGGPTTSANVTVSVSNTPCIEADVIRSAEYAPSNCKQAEFNAGFNGTLALVPLEGLLPDSIPAPATPNAAPAHRVTMTSQPVHGASTLLYGLCVECPNPPGTAPVVPMPTRDSLTATLTASVGSDVTFTFTVTNTKSTSVDVQFMDAQQFDIRVWNDAGTQVWRWASDKGFTQSPVTRTLGPGESATYVEHWTPPASGSYRAMAYLTSTSHAAVGFASFSAP